MSSRGESPHTKLIWINSVLGGMRTNQPHRPAPIVDLHGIVVGRHAVVEDKGSDALPVEPARDIKAFVTQSDVLIASAGNHKDGGFGGEARRDERIQARLVGFRVTKRPGGSAGPQRNGRRITGVGRSLRMKLRRER